MNAQLACPALDPAPTRSSPRFQPLPQEVKLPPLSVVEKEPYDRWYRFSWSFIGTIGYTLVPAGFFSLPCLGTDPFMEFLAPFTFLFTVPVHLTFYYYARVSHLMPSKPVGPFEKHGLELVCLTYAVVERLFVPDSIDRLMGFLLVTGINMIVHSMLQILDWWDFSLIEVMQVADHTCYGNTYAVVAVFILCVMVIGY